MIVGIKPIELARDTLANPDASEESTMLARELENLHEDNQAKEKELEELELKVEDICERVTQTINDAEAIKTKLEQSIEELDETLDGLRNFLMHIQGL